MVLSLDVDGNFTLNNVQENAVLQVSFVGYKTQDIALKGQSNVKVTLEEDTEVLDEVVVIGYGSVKKSTLTGAVAKMDTKGIQRSSFGASRNSFARAIGWSNGTYYYR